VLFEIDTFNEFLKTWELCSFW